MHEYSFSVPCLFGCSGEIDHVAHYLVCPVLGGVVHEVAKVSAQPFPMSIDRALAVAPFSARHLIFIYVKYSLYFYRKHSISPSSIIYFTDHDRQSCVRFAQAVFSKLNSRFNSARLCAALG